MLGIGIDEVLCLGSDLRGGAAGQMTEPVAQLVDGARQRFGEGIDLVVEDGTIRATNPTRPPSPSSRASTAPITRGIPTCPSRVANADSGSASTTTINAASTRVISYWKISPATTSPKASSTQRYRVAGVTVDFVIAL